MAHLEAIIGRETGQRRLLVKIGQKAFAIGYPNSVPNSVSHSHCGLAVDFSDDSTRKVTKIKITNIKPQNVTYVDGNEVETKTISESSQIKLGFDRYPLNLQQVLDGMRKFLGAAPPPPKPEIDISPLKVICEEYDQTKINMQVGEQKRNNYRNLASILSAVGIMFIFIPGMGIWRLPFIIIPALIAIYFFCRGFKTSSYVSVRLHKLDEEFRKKYVCPNPECQHFMGYIPYDVLIQNKKCGYCGSPFKKSK